MDHVGRHIATCPACRGAAHEVQRATVSDSTEIDQHLDELALSELVDVGAVAATSVASIRHLTECAECRAALRQLSDLIADPTIQAEVADLKAADAAGRNRAVPGGRHVNPSRRWGAAAAVLAAAAAVVIVVRSLHVDGVHQPVEMPLRDETVELTAGPRLIAPLGVVSRLDTLRWTSVPRADRYRITIFDESGRIVFEAERSETLAVVSTLGLDSERRYRWKVDARTSLNRWVGSEFADVEVRRAGPERK